jgi:hypothetical protein
VGARKQLQAETGVKNINLVFNRFSFKKNTLEDMKF